MNINETNSSLPGEDVSNDNSYKNFLRQVTTRLSERVMKEVPETGKFREMGVFFKQYRKDTNMGVFNVKYNPRNKDERILELGVTRDYVGYRISNFIKCGTRDEIAEYIADESNLDEFIEIIDTLMVKLEDRD